MEQHEKTVNQQKIEIIKTKRKQQQLDDVYNNGIKELQSLVCAYNKTRANSTANSKERETVNVKTTLSNLVSIVREIFNDFRKKEEKSSVEVNGRQLQIEQLTKDCKTLKQKLTGSNSTCQTNNDLLEKSKNETKQIQLRCRKSDEECGRLQKNVDALKNSLTKEQNYSRELRDQTSSTFVLLLHQLLNTVDDVATAPVATEPSGATAADGETSQKWNDLGLVVNDQVSALITRLNREKEKVTRLEEMLSRKDDEMERLYTVHEEQLAKLVDVSEFAGVRWQTERDELQKLFSTKLLETQTKNTTSSAELRQRLQTANGFQQELETERSRLRARLDQCRRENDALLSTCALLCGCIYPLHARSVTLAVQRNVLYAQFVRFESFKRQVANIVAALSDDDGAARRAIERSRLAPRLRFRAAVVAVVASNRLARFSTRGGRRAFTSYNILPGTYSTVVCSGEDTTTPRNQFAGLNESLGSNGSQQMRGSENLLSWLTSSDLQSAILSSHSDLQTAIYRLKEDAPGYDDARLVNIAKNCFQKFVSHLPNMFPSLTIESERDIADSAFLSSLKNGLNASPRIPAFDLSKQHVGSEQLLKSLQQELLSFTQRLHATEIERRDLRAEVSRLRQQAANKDGFLKRQQQTATVQEQSESVSMEKFTLICDERERALEREEETEKILKLRNDEIDELKAQLDVFVSKGLHKEHTLTETTKILSDVKTELRRKEQLVQQLTHQTTGLEVERTALIDKVQDAERALRTAAKDKQAVIKYTSTLTDWFSKLRATPSPDDWHGSGLLELDLPSAKPGSDLLAVRNLVSAFVTAQNFLLELLNNDETEKNKTEGHRSKGGDWEKQPDVVTVVGGGDVDKKSSGVRTTTSTISPVGFAEHNRLRPLSLVDTNAISSESKRNVPIAKPTLVKVVEKKPKSKLPRRKNVHPTSSRKPASQRYSSPALTSNHYSSISKQN